MKYQLLWSKRPPLLFCAAVLFIVLCPLLIRVSLAEPENDQTPKWTRDLPHSSCPWSSNDVDCHYASPVLVDLTNDGKKEIVVGTNNGNVVVLRADGSLLWQKDIGPNFGMASGKQRIVASPAVADIDKDGQMEVVIGTGTASASECTQGGVIVLEHNGNVKSGWPFFTQDDSIPPAGCRDTVFSTPALGDLDNDGDLEIVFGSFDKRLYALHHNGTMVAGFPANSALFERFGWGNLQGRFADSIWSSPALADLDNDGYLDIVIGTDEGNFDNRYPPAVTPEWQCPYATPGAAGYCGGALYAVDRHGKVLPGFPRYELEIFQSSPAVADVDGNGRVEIFIGTGSYYYERSADHPQNGFRVYGIDYQGKDLPGWEGGKQVGGTVPASPVVGDINGDSYPEIIVAARDKKLYAWHWNGQLVSGFPMTPKTHFGQTLDEYNIPSSFILADFTGNGRNEILFKSAADIVVVNGSGQQLTAAQSGASEPAFYTAGTMWNTPAVGDLDGNGRLELVAHNSRLFVWEFNHNSTVAGWPMFKQNEMRTGTTTPPSLVVQPEAIIFTHLQGDSQAHNFNVSLNLGPGNFNWTVATDQPNLIQLSQTSGTSQGNETINVSITVPNSYGLGQQTLGHINVTAQINGTEPEGSPDSIPVSIFIVDELNQAFIPFISAK